MIPTEALRTPAPDHAGEILLPHNLRDRARIRVHTSCDHRLGADLSPWPSGAGDKCQLPWPPLLAPPPPMLSPLVVIADHGCRAVSGKASGMGEADVAIPMIPLRQAPPMCSRALPLELAVSLSRCEAGRSMPLSTAGEATPRNLHPQQPAIHESLRKGTTKAGEELAGLSCAYSEVAMRPAQPACASAKHPQRAEKTAQETRRVQGIDGDAPVSTKAASEQSAGIVPAPMAATTEKEQDHPSQPAAAMSAGRTPSHAAEASAVRAKAAAAGGMPAEQAGERDSRRDTAAASQQPSQRAPLLAAAAKSKAAAALPCASMSAAESVATSSGTSQRTAAEEAALRAAVEQETRLRQLNRQARLLIQARSHATARSSTCNDA